jgi:hypothetical protein
MAKRTKRWRCTACQKVHGTQKAACDCCEEVFEHPQEVYLCLTCGDSYADAGAAEACCDESGFTEAWACPICEETHGTSDEAAECCPRARMVHVCGACNKHYPSEVEAGSCCLTLTSYRKPRPRGRRQEHDPAATDAYVRRVVAQKNLKP